MSATARQNLLLVPVSKDPRQDAAVLGHVAARLGARLPRTLVRIAGIEILVDARTSAGTFAEWSGAASGFGYRIGSTCAMMVQVDESLAGTLLERQLGGGRSGNPQRAVGECRATALLMRAIADSVSLAVAGGWPGGGVAEFVATDDGEKFARADDNVAIITLAISAAGVPIGEIGVAFAIEGLARVSGPPARPRDDAWAKKLRGGVIAAVRLPVRAILARPEFPAATVLRLAVGDVLPISKPEIVPLYSGEHVVGIGSIIEIAGRTAVQIKTTEPVCND
jgi:flagellar motor switch protein FliM